MINLLYKVMAATTCAQYGPNLPDCIPAVPGLNQFPGVNVGSGSGASGITNPLKYDNLTDLLKAIAYYLYLIVIPLVTIMILYGAFQILTAGGDPAKFETGKKTILYAIIGLVVAIIAGGIPTIIESIAPIK